MVLLNSLTSHEAPYVDQSGEVELVIQVVNPAESHSALIALACVIDLLATV